MVHTNGVVMVKLTGKSDDAVAVSVRGALRTDQPATSGGVVVPTGLEGPASKGTKARTRPAPPTLADRSGKQHRWSKCSGARKTVYAVSALFRGSERFFVRTTAAGRGPTAHDVPDAISRRS